MNDEIQLFPIDIGSCHKEIRKLLLLDPQKNINNYVRTFLDFHIVDLMDKFTESFGKGGRIGNSFVDLIEDILKVCNLVYFSTNHEELVPDNFYVPTYKCFVDLTGRGLHQETPLMTKLEKTSHGYPTLKGSLDKVNNLDDLKRWFSKIIKICRLYKDHAFVIALSPKYDGVSVVLEFDSNGNLIQAVTRGEADVGNDVTATFSHIRCNWIGEIGVKTEAILTEENLQKYNEMTGMSYKNRRSGITSLLNSASSPSYLIDLVPLGFETGLSVNMTDEYRLQHLAGQLITPSQPFTYQIINGNETRCLDQILEFITYMEGIRNELQYPIDGIVIDILNPEIRNVMGRKNDINNFQIAFKFEAQNSETTLRDMFYTVGKTGKITPMALFDDIFFDAVRYDHCTVSSYGTMMSLYLSKGDTIIVQRSGDVIPYLSTNLGGGDGDLFQFPTICPECGSPIYIKKEHAYCLNKQCRGIFKARLVSMVERLDIEDLGEENISTLVNSNIVQNYEDLFVMETVLYIEQNIPNGAKISRNIQNAMVEGMTEEKLIYALSLDNIGIETARKISSKVSLRDLVEMNRYDLKKRLMSIPGIGEIKADNTISQIEENHKLIDFMLFHFNVIKMLVASYKYYSTSGWRPDEATKRQYELAGFKYKENLTKDCQLLVLKNINHISPKTEKAVEGGIDITDRETFEKRFDGLTISIF